MILITKFYAIKSKSTSVLYSCFLSFAHSILQTTFPTDLIVSIFEHYLIVRLRSKGTNFIILYPFKLRSWNESLNLQIKKWIEMVVKTQFDFILTLRKCFCVWILVLEPTHLVRFQWFLLLPLQPQVAIRPHLQWPPQGVWKTTLTFSQPKTSLNCSKYNKDSKSWKRDPPQALKVSGDFLFVACRG